MDLVLDLNGVQMAWDTVVIGQKIVLLGQLKLDDASFADWLRQEANHMEASGDDGGSAGR